MTPIKSLIMAAALAIAFTLPAAAVELGFSAYATGGTAVNAGTNWAIIPGQSINGGTPLITYLSMRSLSAGASTFQTYVSTNQTTLVLTNVALLERTNFVASTNGLAPGGYVILQHLNLPARFQNEALVITTVQNTNQVVFATAPLNPIHVGDIVDQETAWSLISPVSSTTPTTFTGGGILVGQRNEPFLMVLSSAGVGTNTIDAVSSTFAP